jgi:hypothetical protein
MAMKRRAQSWVSWPFRDFLCCFVLLIFLLSFLNILSSQRMAFASRTGRLVCVPYPRSRLGPCMYNRVELTTFAQQVSMITVLKREQERN